MIKISIPEKSHKIIFFLSVIHLCCNDRSESCKNKLTRRAAALCWLNVRPGNWSRYVAWLVAAASTSAFSGTTRSWNLSKWCFRVSRWNTSMSCRNARSSFVTKVARWLRVRHIWKIREQECQKMHVYSVNEGTILLVN